MRMIGVDVGGTFTDIVFTDTATGRTLIHKTPTTPDDPSRAVVDGIHRILARDGLERRCLLVREACRAAFRGHWKLWCRVLALRTSEWLRKSN